MSHNNQYRATIEEILDVTQQPIQGIKYLLYNGPVLVVV
jgi:hypothetical protein